jgi:hypothetical protein
MRNGYNEDSRAHDSTAKHTRDGHEQLMPSSGGGKIISKEPGAPLHYHNPAAWLIVVARRFHGKTSRIFALFFACSTRS